MKCMMKRSKIKVKESLGMKFGVSERCLGDEKTENCQERSRV